MNQAAGLLVFTLAAVCIHAQPDIHIRETFNQGWLFARHPAVDSADEVSCRPDFAVALYPGHLWISSRTFELNPDVIVSRNTPPTFLLQAENDPVDSINNRWFTTLR